MSFSLPTTEEKAEYVLRQFDRIASRYDLTNDAISMGMHHLWKHRAVHELELRPGWTVLRCMLRHWRSDFANRKSHGRQRKSGGLGFFVEHAGRGATEIKESEAGVKLKFIQGDAWHCRLTMTSFDGAIVSFGLRNLTDYQKGINEMTSVVKPGGR